MIKFVLLVSAMVITSPSPASEVANPITISLEYKFGGFAESEPRGSLNVSVWKEEQRPIAAHSFRTDLIHGYQHATLIHWPLRGQVRALGVPLVWADSESDDEGWSVPWRTIASLAVVAIAVAALSSGGDDEEGPNEPGTRVACGNNDVVLGDQCVVDIDG